MAERLGFGVGFRPQHYTEATSGRRLHAHQRSSVTAATPIDTYCATPPSTPASLDTHQKRAVDPVDWFEIVSENFMGVGGRPRRFLESLRSQYPVGMHGVSLSIGGLDPLSREYLRRLKELATWLEPAIVSDHLCWTSHGGHNAHDLLPLCFTEEALRRTIIRVVQVQDVLGRPILLENPSAYVAAAASEMSEATFLHELCRESGCGVLLDINNLFVNAHNLGYDPAAYMATLRGDWVAQFHLAGHSHQEGVLIDTHDQPIPTPVWTLFRAAVRLWPQAATLVEWDESLPPYTDLVNECAKAREHHAAALRENALHEAIPYNVSSALHDVRSAPRPGADREWHKALWELVARPEAIGSSHPALAVIAADRPVSAISGASVYNHAYFLRILACLEDTFPTLAHVMQSEGFAAVVAAYLAEVPPRKEAVRFAGEGFADWLAKAELPIDFGVPNSVLADIAAFDWARADAYEAPDGPCAIPATKLGDISPEEWETVGFKIAPTARMVVANCDVAAIWRAVAEGSAPERPIPKNTWSLIYRDDLRASYKIHIEALTEDTAEVFLALQSGTSFHHACRRAARGRGLEDLTPTLVAALAHWFELGLIVDIDPR